MNYTITEATLDDVPDIVEITMVSFADAFNEPFYLSREDATHRWAAYMQKKHHPQKAKDPRVVYIAISDGETVGFIAGHLSERFDLEGELQSIYILPEHQRKGLGTLLTIKLAEWFRKWNAKEICVGPVDGSEGFYIKLGAHPNEHGWLVWNNFFEILSK